MVDNYIGNSAAITQHYRSRHADVVKALDDQGEPGEPPLDNDELVQCLKNGAHIDEYDPSFSCQIVNPETGKKCGADFLTPYTDVVTHFEQSHPEVQLQGVMPKTKVEGLIRGKNLEENVKN